MIDLHQLAVVVRSLFLIASLSFMFIVAIFIVNKCTKISTTILTHCHYYS